jgi:hypothetical protein
VQHCKALPGIFDNIKQHGVVENNVENNETEAYYSTVEYVGDFCALFFSADNTGGSSGSGK